MKSHMNCLMIKHIENLELVIKEASENHRAIKKRLIYNIN